MHWTDFARFARARFPAPGQGVLTLAPADTVVPIVAPPIVSVPLIASVPSIGTTNRPDTTHSTPDRTNCTILRRSDTHRGCRIRSCNLRRNSSNDACLPNLRICSRTPPSFVDSKRAREARGNDRRTTGSSSSASTSASRSVSGSAFKAFLKSASRP